MAVEDKAAQDRLHHAVSQDDIIPTKGWPNCTMNTFCLTSLGCLPARWRGKMPTSYSSEAVEGITMHMPMCDIRGTLRSINLAHVPYITLGDGKGDLYSPLCLF